jgi:hypothetical protein
MVTVSPPDAVRPAEPDAADPPHPQAHRITAAQVNASLAQRRRPARPGSAGRLCCIVPRFVTFAPPVTLRNKPPEVVC